MVNDMDTPDPALEQVVLTDLAYEQLAGVEQSLKAARKILARDWPDLTPRERSAHSRIVKQLEQQQQALLESIAMHRPAG